jgi:acetyl-CoA/propionyl-CoA carboxylase, biotin carboxylase, biotin carboxyl carrier protein
VTGPLLIANRGEIAARVARTARRLGLATVALAGPGDEAAPHADACDAAVRVPSYLDVEAVLDAARRTGARAVHPGYGFLSENARFAQSVVDAGLVWVGPPPQAIELMGDKGRAKDAAAAAGVPVVPPGDDTYPVVVKAVAGGGGKGMRVVRRPEDLEEATAAAQREARAAFGDDRVIVERWIDRPRHIEVQVIADAHGAVAHLGERECSLQRRHQKVVEEAPSPVVGPDLRERMGAAAVALARACGYVGAGTVEFVATADASDFFFLEMNTRLQVEHPVTELVWGVDLVELQLRVAAGEPLPPLPSAPTGWAVEARLYAEDPAAGFLPATGTVRRWRPPAGVRVDAGVREGSEVTTSYDPMLAKVVARGADRAEALRRLDRALADLEVLGVTTNAAFTRALLAREDVRAGEMDTGLLERILEEAVPVAPDDLLPAAALAAAGTATPPGPWRRAFEGGVARVQAGEVTIEADGAPPRRHAAALRRAGDGALRITLDGVERRYVAEVAGEAVWIARDGHHLEARTARPARDAHHALEGSLEAPMPGVVLQVRVADGDEVQEGDVLVVLESMKMELSIAAPYAGRVEGLALREGERVERGQVLVAVTPA